MVFVAALALAALMMLAIAVERWDSGLSGSMTVQVPPGTNEAQTQQKVERVVQVLQGAPGVESAVPLSRARMTELLQPWLGAAAATDDLPLPWLIDVQRQQGTEIDIAGLARRVADAVPGSIVDDHMLWLSRLVRYARVLEAAASLTVAIITGSAIATVIFVTLTRMSIHRDVIDLLHLMGATDRYVARQFKRHALLLGLVGGLIGLCGAAALLAALDWASSELGDMLLPVPRLRSWHWAVLGVLPVATGIIAMVTAGMTVMSRLRRVP